MSYNDFALHVKMSFRNWVIYAQNEDIVSGGNPTCLADFIRAWVESGDGVKVCLGDFQTFLIGAVAIIDAWHTDHDGELLKYLERGNPESTGLTERRTARIFDPEDEYHYENILDPHWFAECTFKTLHPELTRK